MSVVESPVRSIPGREVETISPVRPGDAGRRRPAARSASRFTPLATQSDDELARLVQDGSMPAFEELHGRYVHVLQRFCLSMLGRPGDAEEAVQAAMLNAYRALTARQVDAARLNTRAWLFRIAKNMCLDALRRRSREIAGDSEAEPIDHIGPHRIAAGRAELRQVLDDITALSESQRSALILREMSGLSNAEIAQSLSTDAVHAKSLVAQARVSLAAANAGRELPCAEVRARLAGGDRRNLRSRELKAHLRWCPECAARAPAPRARQDRAA